MKSRTERLLKEAENLYRSGNYHEAIEILESLEKIDPENAAGYIHNLGAVYLERIGDGKKAEEYFRRVLEIDPNFVPSLRALGNCVTDENELIDLFRRVIKIIPDDPVANYNIGVYEAGLKNFDAALMYFERSIRSAPDNPLSYNNAGRVKAIKGRTLEALVDFRVALLIGPNFSLARRNLDDLLKHGDVRKLIEGSFTLLDSLHHEDIRTYGYRGAVIRLASNYATCNLDGDDRSILAIDCRYAMALKITTAPDVEFIIKAELSDKGLKTTIPDFGTPTLAQPTEIEYDDMYGVFEHDEVKLMAARNNGKVRVLPVNLYIANRLNEINLDNIELIEFQRRIKQLDLTRNYGDINIFSPRGSN